MARNRKRTAEFKRSRSTRRTKSQRNVRLGLERLEPRLVLATNVLSYHMDLQSSGVNSTETLLTTGNVNTATFGRTSIDPPRRSGLCRAALRAWREHHDRQFSGRAQRRLRRHRARRTLCHRCDRRQHPVVRLVPQSGDQRRGYHRRHHDHVRSQRRRQLERHQPRNRHHGNADDRSLAKRTVRHHQDEADRAGRQVSITRNYVADAVQDQYSKRRGDRQPHHRRHRRLRNAVHTYRTQTSASDPNQDPFVFGNGDGCDHRQ